MSNLLFLAHGFEITAYYLGLRFLNDRLQCIRFNNK